MSDITALLTGEEFVADPYPAYDTLRDQGRVLWVEEMRRWLITGHQEALAVFSHEKVSSNRALAEDSVPWPEGGIQPRGLPFTDPPDHTRLRRLVQHAFTVRRVEQQRRQVADLVADLLAAVAGRDEFDLVADVAGPLPAIVLARLLGIPPEDHETFRRWVTTVIETIDPVSLRLKSGEDAEDRISLEKYFEDIIEQRRRRPEDDLISALVEAEESDERLTAREILEMCVVLTMAGLEATTNLVANGMYALLQHPDQLARLRAEPGLIKTAVEELLRYDAPVQLAGRVMMQDIEIGGRLLRKGQTAGVVIGAVNRDPRAFAEPERLDLARDPNNHLGFGRGIHHCVGAPLARLEAPIAITALVTRFPGLRLAGPPKRGQNIHVRGFESLPLAPG